MKIHSVVLIQIGVDVGEIRLYFFEENPVSLIVQSYVEANNRKDYQRIRVI